MGGGGEMIKLSWVKLDTWNLDHLGVERGDKIKIRIKCNSLSLSGRVRHLEVRVEHRISIERGLHQI